MSVTTAESVENAPLILDEDGELESGEGLSYNDRLKWEALRSRTLYLSDEIEDHSARKLSMELQLLANTSITEPIKVVITSPGGVVLPGLAIFDEMIELQKKHGLDITTHVAGYAASMGAIVLQAGNKRTAFKNSRILIHEVSTFKFFSQDRSSDLEDQLKETKKLEEILFSILANKTKKPVAELRTLCRKTDVWFSATEAMEFGLIDEVI